MLTSLIDNVSSPNSSADRLRSKRILLNTDFVDSGLGSDLVQAARNRLVQAQKQHHAVLQNLAEQRMQEVAHKRLQRQARQLAKQMAMARATHLPSVANTYNPTGGMNMPRPTGDLKHWIHRALKITGHRHEHLARGIRNMIEHESGGNPRAINNWDSNAAAGTPSIGLMQTIQPTFNAYALPGHRNIYDPVDNIIAGLRYALSRYGAGMVRAGGRHDSRGNYLGY